VTAKPAAETIWSARVDRRRHRPPGNDRISSSPGCSRLLPSVAESDYSQGFLSRRSHIFLRGTGGSGHRPAFAGRSRGGWRSSSWGRRCSFAARNTNIAREWMQGARPRGLPVRNHLAPGGLGHPPLAVAGASCSDVHVPAPLHDRNRPGLGRSRRSPRWHPNMPFKRSATRHTPEV